MQPLRRPDLELFLPERDIFASGSHAGVFALAIERLKAAAAGRRLLMAGHQVSQEMFGYIIYGWVDTLDKNLR